MKRKVGYTWRLREIMADQRIYTATELVPLLRERGIDLSASQIHRLVLQSCFVIYSRVRVGCGDV
ncbi:hypothetical protein ACWDLG_44565 [Nonomuraea sp. NPDC003727]